MTATPVPTETWGSIADSIATGLTDAARRLDAGDWAGLAKVGWSPPDLPPMDAPTQTEMERLRTVIDELTRLRSRVEEELATVQQLRTEISRRRTAVRAYAHAPTGR